MTIAVAYHSFGSPFISNLLSFWVVIEVLHDTLLGFGGEHRSSHFVATKFCRNAISLTACFRRIHLYPCKSTLPLLGCCICHPGSNDQCLENYYCYENRMQLLQRTKSINVYTLMGRQTRGGENISWLEDLPEIPLIDIGVFRFIRERFLRISHYGEATLVTPRSWLLEVYMLSSDWKMTCDPFEYIFVRDCLI